MIIKRTFPLFLIFTLCGCSASLPLQKSPSSPTSSATATLSPTNTPFPTSTLYLTPTPTPVPFINISLLPPGEYFTEDVSITGEDMYLAVISINGDFKGYLAKIIDQYAQLSPDLRYLVDTYYITDLSSGEKTAFANLKGCSSAYWAPDSKHLITSCPTLDTTGTENVDSLYVFSLADHSMTQITYSPYPKNSSGARWSPDGKWIAYEGVEARSGESAYNGLHIINTKCFNKPFTCWQGEAGIDLRRSITWSPDGHYLAGIYNSYEIKVFQIEEGSIILSRSYPMDLQIDWIRWSPHGDQIVISKSDGYFLLDVKAGKLMPFKPPSVGKISQLVDWFLVP